MKVQDTKALARIAAADIQAANGDPDAVQKTIIAAMTAAQRDAREKSNQHTLSDGAVNALVSAGTAAGTREVQNIAEDIGRAFGGENGAKRARAITTRVLGGLGLVGVLATRAGSRANQVADKALTVATLDVVDGVHGGIRNALVGAPSPASEVMHAEVVSH